MRTIITEPPFADFSKGTGPWEGRGTWPAKWVACPGCDAPPFVAAYRLRFTCDKRATVRLHVTADERYELFLDGERIGRGSERGDLRNWFFETYDLRLPAGEHVLVARTWALGDLAPFAQMTVRPGFLLAAEGTWTDRLSTGIASWEAKRLGGYEHVKSWRAWGTGGKVVIHGAAFPWGFETGQGDGWATALVGPPGHNAGEANEVRPMQLLVPAALPPMMEVERRVGIVRHVDAPPSADTESVPVLAANHLADEAARWNLVAGAGPVTVPPHTRRRVILDLQDYYCAYPEVVTSGGRDSMVRLQWAEALYLTPKGQDKGNRNEIEGKFFLGAGDAFRPDGGAGRRFDTLWWEAGRYVELFAETADEPLVIERVTLRETRYPLESEAVLAPGDARLGRVFPLAMRTLQMCSHETYFDCPYYEQLMYVGDTRLEVLATYCTTHDDRLPRKALRMFDESRLPLGLTQSRYPSRVTQVIPPFSLWWVGMVSDFGRWRDDPAALRRLMPGVRAVVDAFHGCLNADGMVQAPPGWNYLDWVPTWRWGIPADADRGVNAGINWQYVLALLMAAELEATVGEHELAARDNRLARTLARRLAAAFWDAKRGLLADDLAKQHFSEHVQCLALLSGRLDERKAARVARGLFEAPDLARTTIYFTHYLFETCCLLGRMDVLFQRLGLWLDLPDLGFKTTFEHPEPSRSDCHAWAAHPIFHYFATILGIRPASPGFATVSIRPQLGPLAEARGKLVHPRGFIDVALKADGPRVGGRIVLPEGVSGTFVSGKKRVKLHAGAQNV